MTLYTQYIHMLIERMLENGIFIPGLFATANSQKYAAVKDAVAPCRLQIADFSNEYKKKFCYADFTGKLNQTIDSLQPDFIICFSFGHWLMQTLAAENKTLAALPIVSIVPPGDYAASENGGKILSGLVTPEEMYAPIRELKIGPKATGILL